MARFGSDRGFSITRRTLLRGAGGLAVALPPLEIMLRAAPALAAPPKRYVVCFGGTSTGAYKAEDFVVPATAGKAFAPSYALMPVTKLNVAGEIGIVSGLKVPWGATGAVPPGGRIVNFHGTTMVPQVAGVKCLSRGANASGPTSDQIVADAIAGTTAHRLLSLRAQPVSYAGGSGGNNARMSWDKKGKAVDPIVSPRLLYQSLFAGFQPPDQAGASKAALQIARRKSVLDVVRGNTERLMPRLGPSDRGRMQKHFDELRDLEKRLTAVTPSADARCRAPVDPGADPPIGSNHDVSNPNSLKFVETAGYSQEDKRAEILCDFVHLALACDLSRVASVVFTMVQCFMNMVPIAGQKSDMHELSHGKGTAKDMADGVAWHVKHFARLVAKLRDTPETDGSTLLDHAALAMVFEGGHGFDPESNGQNAAHSSENMVALIAGRAGGLRAGQHIVAKDKHPAQVVLSAMNAVGVQGPLGDITTNIPELFAK